MALIFLQGGWIKSKNDGDLHWISVGQLARLYHLRPNEYHVLGPGDGIPEGAIVLGPRYDGNYNRPNI